MMKVKKIPQRKCLGCNEMKDKKALLRVVRSPEGEVSLDLTRPDYAATSYNLGSSTSPLIRLWRIRAACSAAAFMALSLT